MDDFERAIFFSFDQSGAVDAQLKAQAISFCEQAKQLPSIWQACFNKFRISQYAEVQFWCLQALEEVTRQRYVSLDPQERLFVKNSLMELLCNCNVNGQTLDAPRCLPSRPAFVKNKLAQIVVILIGFEYPSQWPSVFLDMLTHLSKGPAVVDMFCRIFNTLDEEVISLDFPRSFEEITAATRIKDGMRQQCIAQIVGAWYSLAVTYRVGQPYLATAVLDTVHRYVAWIDIGLVANDSFIPLLFEILVSNLEASQLRGAAADCLLAIVSKKMEATSKLALLQKLHIGQVCSRLAETQEPEFTFKVSALLTGLGTEILECSKKFDLSGLSTVTPACTEAALTMLDEVFPSVIYFMRHGNVDISSTTLQFLSNYVGRMNNGMGCNGKQAATVAQILEVIRNRMLYDPFSNDCLGGPHKSGQEDEERLVDFRKDLFGLFRIIHRVAPDETRTFVQSNLRAALRNPDVSFEYVEAAISLLYVLGEGVTEDALQVGNGVLGDMVGMLLSSSVPRHSYRVVALIYLETVTRFVRFVQLHPEHIPFVLAAFLDSRGLHHPNPVVRSRANYLFMRLVKVLRSQLTPYVDDIFQTLQDTLCVYTSKTMVLRADTDDRSYGYEVQKLGCTFHKSLIVQLGQSTEIHQCSPHWTSCHDPIADPNSQLLQAAGSLIGMEDLPEEKQLKFVSALLLPLCTQVDIILSGQTVNGDLTGSATTVVNLQHVILAISHLSKGFGEQFVNSSRPSIGNMFKQTLDLILRILVAFPRDKVLRSRVISVLHRMVDILGSTVFSSLPAAIKQLLNESEPRDLLDFLPLMNQLINKFNSGMSNILQEIFPAVANRIFALLPIDGLREGPGTNSEEVRELQELQRCVFTFLHVVTSNDLSLVLITPQSNPWLTDLSELLLRAACNHRDVLVRKICVQTFTKLITDWCGDNVEEEKVPGFRHFVMDRYTSDCCICSVLQTNFDLRDANTFSLLGEIVTSLRVIYKKCGVEFLVHLATKLLPGVHCPPNLAEQYCLHIQRSDSKDVKAFYKLFIEKLRLQQNGSVGYR